jgi:hypothetical protein
MSSCEECGTNGMNGMNSVNLLLILMPLGLCGGMIVAAVAGHRLAVARRQRLDTEATVGTSAIDAAVLGLLGLLVAFWFSSAGTRLDIRRSLIVEEANSIGTAWLRLDLLPEDVEVQVRDLFRHYVDVRLAQTTEVGRPGPQEPLDRRLTELRHAIWGRAVAAAPRSTSDQAAAILLESLNGMFDAGTRHQAAFDAHTPTAILVLLLAVGILSALLAGHDMGCQGTFNPLHVVVFAGVVSLTIWVIYDLEMPRYGLIRVDNFDKTMLDVRADFQWPDAKPAP